MHLWRLWRCLQRGGWSLLKRIAASREFAGRIYQSPWERVPYSNRPWQFDMPRFESPVAEVPVPQFPSRRLLVGLGVALLLVLIPLKLFFAIPFLVGSVFDPEPTLGIPKWTELTSPFGPYSQTFFTGSTKYTGSKEARITACNADAAAAATATGLPTYSLVPGSMLPYNPVLVTFNSAVKMLREWSDPAHWDVLAYGAFGIDGTNDDRTAFDAAIVGANAAGGGTVYAPKGTYGVRTGGGIQMRANVRIVGERRGTVITSQPGVTPTHLVNFEAQSPTDAGIFECVIDGAGVNTTDLVVIGLSAARITVERNILRNTKAIGINGNCTVTTGECYIRWNIFEGTLGTTPGADHVIRVNYPSLIAAIWEIVGNRIPMSAGFGIGLKYVDGALVSLNTVKGDGTGTFNEAYNIDRCRACRLVGNYGGYRGDFGLTLHTNNTSDPNDLHTVCGNIFEFNKDAGIAVTGKTRWASLTGNTLRNNAQSAPVGAECQIIVDTGSASAKPTFNVIEANTLVDDQGVPTALYGVVVNGVNCEDTFIGTNPTSGMAVKVKDTGTRTRVRDEHATAISADRGDTNQTLTVGTDARTQRWATTLGANRTVTLSTTGVYPGAKFRVIRTGLGAFTLDVGGLKTIPSGTAAFVDVEWDALGSAWRLAAYGTL